MVTSVSPAHEGRTISSSPDTTTENGTVLSPCSTSTSPGWIARICPCTAIRLICAGVRIGNICSTRAPTSHLLTIKGYAITIGCNEPSSTSSSVCSGTSKYEEKWQVSVTARISLQTPPCPRDLAGS